HVCVSKVLAVIHPYLHKMSGYMLKQDPKQVVSHVFLGMLLIVALQSIFPQPSLEWAMTPVMIVAVALGVVTFYLNRDKLGEIEEEARQEEIEEKRRELEFGEKYPRVNGVWGVRRVVRWMYKVGWWYSTVVIILVIIGFSIRLYGLGELSLWWDELITGTVVTRIRETGLPLQPSGLEYYWRGVVYHYFVVIFTYLFGLTEFAIRFPSVLFGMGIVFLSFLVGKKIDKWVGLLVLVFMIFSTYNIEYSRFARFYVMNAFLFMVSIFFVYEGFFKDKMKYKIASSIIFLVMMHTVQLGRFFIFIIGAYFGYEFIRFTISKEKSEIVKQNKINFIFLGLTLIILKLDNLFERFLNFRLVRAFEVMDTVATPAPYPIIKIPEWDLFKFFDGVHIPVIFIIMFLIFSIFVLLKSIRKNKNEFLAYISILFFISVISFEFLNRDITGARICLIFEGLYVIFSLYIMYNILKISIKQKNISKFVSLIVVILLLVSITPNFYERITLNYGEDVNNDPFRTTNVAAYRADYKTQYLYLAEHIKMRDIWINVVDSPYFYFDRSPDYMLNQNNRWNTNTILDDKNNFISTGSGAVVINKVSDIEKIIEKNPNRNIWLIVNGGSINIMYTTHIRSDFLRFLEENKDEVIYESSDGLSRVLLFKNKQMENDNYNKK
ncbi:glycosyltransferase family 39 protein, partial [bacterium]|nr:glycosyltransferase family 39 protein [bacterium]